MNAQEYKKLIEDTRPHTEIGTIEARVLWPGDLEVSGGRASPVGARDLARWLLKTFPEEPPEEPNETP